MLQTTNSGTKNALIADAGRELGAGTIMSSTKRSGALLTILAPSICGALWRLGTKKIAALAEAHYATMAPHMYCGPVGLAAAIQLDTCSPNFLIQEYNTTSLHNEILKEPLRIEKGFISPPTSPGLGIELNEQVVKRQISK